MKYLFTFGLSAKPATYFTVVLCFLIFSISCTEDRFLTEVDVDLENPQTELVLESTYRLSDSILTVFFSNTQSILDETSSSLIDDANVEVFVNDISLGILEEVIVNSWRDNEPGSIYQVELDNNQIKAGDEIRIEATDPSGNLVRAVEQMPNAANLVSATYLQDRQTAGYYYSDNSMRIVIDDPGNEDNRYIFFAEERVRELDPFSSTGMDTLLFVNRVFLEPGDEFSDGDYLEYPIANDLTFNGNRGSVLLGTWWEPRTSSTNEEPRLFLTLGTINKAAYDYDKTLDALIGSEGNPFAEPAVLPTSIEGGRGVLRLINDASMIEASLE